MPPRTDVADGFQEQPSEPSPVPFGDKRRKPVLSLDLIEPITRQLFHEPVG